MLKRGSKGRAITELQSALIELGYDLPRWGIDGDLGDETLHAFELFLTQHDDGALARDGNRESISDSELAFLFHARDVSRTEIKPPRELVDRRQFASRVHDAGPRPWSAISGICLHQTACDMGELAPRYDTIGAHAVVTRAGKAFWEHDFNRLIWHAQRWSPGTIGIEFNGLYAGVEGDPDTVWNDPSTARREIAQAITTPMVATGRSLIKWAIAECARHGSRIRVIVAHRQSSRNRRNDPGSAIWQAVALPLIEELGLSDGGAGFTVGGLPIPVEWDASRKGFSY